MIRIVSVAAMVLYLGFTNTSVLEAQPNVDFDPEQIQVLIITGQNVHPWRETTPVMKQILGDWFSII
jgi:hypothetical protein